MCARTGNDSTDRQKDRPRSAELTATTTEAEMETEMVMERRSCRWLWHDCGQVVPFGIWKLFENATAAVAYSVTLLLTTGPLLCTNWGHISQRHVWNRWRSERFTNLLQSTRPYIYLSILPYFIYIISIRYTMKLISLLFPFFLRKKKCNHSQLYTTLSISQLIFNDFYRAFGSRSFSKANSSLFLALLVLQRKNNSVSVRGRKKSVAVFATVA